MTRIVPVDSAFSRNLSKRASHAVIAVSGSAAASAKLRLAGFRATMRSSTSWRRVYEPGRSRLPA